MLLGGGAGEVGVFQQGMQAHACIHAAGKAEYGGFGRLLDVRRGGGFGGVQLRGLCFVILAVAVAAERGKAGVADVLKRPFRQPEMD